MKNIQFSRRNLLGASVAALASSAFAAKASANPAPVPQKWDEEVDVIVVGSGFAGLAAAYEAAKAGSKVIILEKMPTHGGNSIINCIYPHFLLFHSDAPGLRRTVEGRYLRSRPGLQLPRKNSGPGR